MAPGTSCNVREEEAHGHGGARQPTFEFGLLFLAAAITSAMSKPPPWLHRDAYFLALSAAFFSGVIQVATSVWAADGAGSRRHAAGRKLVHASLVATLVAAAGLALASLLQ